MLDQRADGAGGKTIVTEKHFRGDYMGCLHQPALPADVDGQGELLLFFHSIGFGRQKAASQGLGAQINEQFQVSAKARPANIFLHVKGPRFT